MSSISLIALPWMLGSTSMGAFAFKHYAVSRELPWLVAGIVAYNLSNIGWIALIDQAGIARAASFVSAAQILVFTAFGILSGEQIGIAGWIAALMVCFAMLLTVQAPASRPAVREPHAFIETSVQQAPQPQSHNTGSSK